jgi:hypothetical protein
MRGGKRDVTGKEDRHDKSHEGLNSLGCKANRNLENRKKE